MHINLDIGIIGSVDLGKEDKMIRLYFVRHGKTKWNLESRYQGMHGDSPLLDESYQEIKLLAKSLSGVPFAHIYASPIKRARDTANYLRSQLRKSIPLSLVSGISEFDLGKMEGMLFNDVKQQFPTAFDAFRNHPDRYDADEIQGESFEQVMFRFKNAVDEIVQANQGEKNVIIVSHGAAMNAGINGLLGVSIEHLRDRGGLSNTSTTIIDADQNGYHLVKWNETSYLNRSQNDPTDTI
ncbi:phosphoglycerate mutase [Paucilactobacillus suebicus DSM 5007 = KCTC 3549]|uniref:Phosphoglycerate mutase n=2 Tax=Paucilactobacillus suebicus TaxID=152335 RepID=A0A0R1W450_9LACO|nr:phosphoglycerate mutase [Paucilactobacillus suebicus DSM 5007 = KCTC 3549]